MIIIVAVGQALSSQQQPIVGHRRSITTSNNTRRTQAYSSLIGKVIIEDNILGPVMIAQTDELRVEEQGHHSNTDIPSVHANINQLKESINNLIIITCANRTQRQRECVCYVDYSYCLLFCSSTCGVNHAASRMTGDGQRCVKTQYNNGKKKNICS